MKTNEKLTRKLKELTDNELVQVAGGDANACPSFADREREKSEGRIGYVMGSNNVIDEYAPKDKRVK